jgi:PAS domain S-box-containing protein
MLNAQGEVMTWNEGARLIKGYTRAEIVGQPMSRFYSPEDQAAGRPAQLLHEAMENGRVEDEGWRVRKDGTRFWADVVITAVRDDQGTLIGFAKITRDLTERRKAEAAIGELSGRLLRLQDDERQQLATKLHDRSSSYLTAVLGSLYRVKAHLKSADVLLLNDVADSISKVEAASDVIRRLSHTLYPTRLEEGGLLETLRWYVKSGSGPRLNVRAELPTSGFTMSKEADVVMFRLVQECLNYLVGRPGEREILVRLDTKGDLVVQVIVTGPVPFGLRDALSASRDEIGGGFAGIRQRLRQLGGKLDVMSGEHRMVVEASLTRGA